MNSTQRVRNTILGLETDRQPIYGWVSANLDKEISRQYGSVAAFEDHYEFDMAHIFGGPNPVNEAVVEKLKKENEEMTPDLLLEADFITSPENTADYENIKASIAHHKERDRFCYVQTPGFFEHFNGVFGIENQLMYLGLYPEEMGRLYHRQTEWTLRYIDHVIDLGADMVHISDDWGAQNNLLFSPDLWWELIYPEMKRLVDFIHSRGALASVHSDGCVMKVADGIAKLGLDLVHPWQENAGMSYDVYLEKYADRFAILGGVCVQSAIGILPQDKLAAEIRRVFQTLRGKRWICCTSHFVQNHCSMEDLNFAFDLIYRLAREK